MEYVEKFTPYLFNLYTGTIIFVIVLGYIIRVVPAIDNKWIPLIVISAGSIAFLIIAPLTLKPDPLHAWNWYVMLWMAGLALSAVAWMFHRLVLSRLEEIVTNKFPLIGKILNPENKPAPSDPPVNPNNPDRGDGR